MTDPLENLIAIIQQLKFFTILPKEKIVELASCVEKVKLQAGQKLFSQGDPAMYLYILMTGELITLLTRPSGKTLIVGTINPGETIGELGAISGESRSLTVEAVVDSELLKIPNDIFKKISSEYPAILSEISKLVIQRAVKTINLMAYEKIQYHVSIIFPELSNIPTETLKNTLQQYLSEFNATFVSTEEATSSEIKKLIRQESVENRHIFIFMETWQEELFKFCKGKLHYLYFVVSEGEKTFPSNQAKNIIYNIKDTSIRLELIILHPDKTKHITNTYKWLEKADFNLHHHVRINHAEDCKRLARFMTGNAFTLVLGGGGAKGLVHLGVIKAILEKGISIDAIGGTSIGASIAACYALTLNYKTTLGFINQLKKATLQSISFFNLTWPIVSLYSSNPATKKLMYILNTACIEDLWIPYFSVSANLTEQKENVHTRGLLWRAVRSSTAIPGIFPPLVADGRLLFDGGLLNNLPVDVMREMVGPYNNIAACSLTRMKTEQRYYFPPVITLTDAILNRLRITNRDYVFPYFFEVFLDALLLGSSSTEQKNCQAADLLIRPYLAGFKMLSIPEKKEQELIEIGYSETMREIEDFLDAHPYFKK